MGSRPKLSVVIPSYNTCIYIVDSISSVVNDVPSAEIIVVDDASTDDTIDLLKSLNLKQLQIIELKQNTPGGAGKPSNLGVEKASGEYIAFLDSDDFIFPGYLSRMIRKMDSSGADLCVSSYKMIDAISHSEHPPYDNSVWNNFTRGKESGSLAMEQYFLLSPEPWRKIYHSRIFKDDRIRFPVNGWFNEDYPFHWLCGLGSRKGVVFINCQDYFHRISRSGQTTSAFDERIFCVFDHTKVIMEFINQDKHLTKYLGSLLNWLLLGAWKTNYLKVRLEEYYKKFRKLILSFNEDAVARFHSVALWEQKRAYRNIKKYDDVHVFVKKMRWPDSEK